MAPRELTPLGSFWVTQVFPPLPVDTTEADPTASQRVSDTHEMAPTDKPAALGSFWVIHVLPALEVASMTDLFVGPPLIPTA
jgi:hypothetical protein